MEDLGCVVLRTVVGVCGCVEMLSEVGDEAEVAVSRLECENFVSADVDEVLDVAGNVNVWGGCGMSGRRGGWVRIVHCGCGLWVLWRE